MQADFRANRTASVRYTTARVAFTIKGVEGEVGW